VALFVFLDGPLLLVEGMLESYRWLPWMASTSNLSLTGYLDGVVYHLASLLNPRLLLALPLLVTGALMGLLQVAMHGVRDMASHADLRPWTLGTFVTTVVLSLAVVMTARLWLRVLVQALFDTLALIFS